MGNAKLKIVLFFPSFNKRKIEFHPQCDKRIEGMCFWDSLSDFLWL